MVGKAHPPLYEDHLRENGASAFPREGPSRRINERPFMRRRVTISVNLRWAIWQTPGDAAPIEKAAAIKAALQGYSQATTCETGSLAGFPTAASRFALRYAAQSKNKDVQHGTKEAPCFR